MKYVGNEITWRVRLSVCGLSVYLRMYIEMELTTHYNSEVEYLFDFSNSAVRVRLFYVLIEHDIYDNDDVRTIFRRLFQFSLIWSR